MASALALAEDLKAISQLLNQYGFPGFVADYSRSPPKYAIAYLTRSQEEEFKTFVLIHQIDARPTSYVGKFRIYGYLS